MARWGKHILRGDSTDEDPKVGGGVSDVLEDREGGW